MTLNPQQQMFQYQGTEVRVVMINGEPKFVAKDVCDVLGIIKVDRVVAGLDDDEKDTHSVSTLGGNQNMMIVTEPGLYSLILRSRKPEAKAFKRWIVHEVLPSIRKTGSYTVQPRPQFVIPQTMGELSCLAESLFEENQKLLLKAEAFDEFLSADNASTIGTAGQFFGIGERHFFQFLREQKILKKNKTTPYQKYLDRGYFNIKFTTKYINGKTHVFAVTLITPKGLLFLSKKFNLHPVPYENDCGQLYLV